MKRLFIGLLAVVTAVITHIVVWMIIMYYPLSFTGAFLIVSFYPIGMMIALHLAETCYYYGKS